MMNGLSQIVEALGEIHSEMEKLNSPKEPVLRLVDYERIARHESSITGAELDLRMQWHESDMIDGAVFREAVCESIMGMQNPQELYRLFIAGSPMFGEVLRKLALRYIDHQAEALADSPLFFEPEPIRNRELLA